MPDSNNKTYWFQRHPRLTLLFVAVFGCILLIVPAEFAARLFLPALAPTREERVKFWRYDELLGWSHTPNQHGCVNHRDFSVEVTINSHGLRDSEYTLDRKDKKRMLILGDSFGWGFGVEQSERFSEVIESAHPDWEIINASVSGYGTDQQFLYLRERGMAFKADAVLLLFCDNDLTNNLDDEQYWHNKPYFTLDNNNLQLQNTPVPKATLKQRIDRTLLGRTYLGKGIYFTIRKISRFISVSSRDKTRSDTRQTSGQEIQYEMTFHLLKAIDTLCREHNTRFIIVNIPMDAEKRLFLQELSDKEHIPHLSLQSTFEKTGSEVTFPHDPHWNARGHAVAAGVIEDFLYELKLF